MKEEEERKYDEIFKRRAEECEKKLANRYGPWLREEVFGLKGE